MKTDYNYKPAKLTINTGEIKNGHTVQNSSNTYFEMVSTQGDVIGHIFMKDKRPTLEILTDKSPTDLPLDCTRKLYRPQGAMTTVSNEDAMAHAVRTGILQSGGHNQNAELTIANSSMNPVLAEFIQTSIATVKNDRANHYRSTQTEKRKPAPAY